MTKKIHPLIILLFLTGNAICQNVGIGTQFPISKLSIDSGLNIDQANVNGISLQSALTFGNDKQTGIGSRRTFGTNQYGIDFYTKGSRRVSIDTLGNVGIGTTSPVNKLDVIGDVYINSRLGIGVSSPLYSLHTNTGYFSSRIGVGTEPNVSYAIDALGSARFQNDVRINGTLNPNNALTIGNNTTVEGSATINGNQTVNGNVVATGTVRSEGRGLVKGTGTAMQRMERMQIELSAVNLAAGSHTNSAAYSYTNGSFSSVPFVMVGQLISSVGGEGARLQFVPYDVTTTSFKIRVFNHCSSTASLTATYEVLIIGAD